MNLSRLFVPTLLALASTACGSGGNPGSDAAVLDANGTGNDAVAGGDAASSVVYTRYTEGTPPASVTFVNACTAGSPAHMGSTDDSLNSDSAAPITTPFPIHLYADSFTTLRVSTNGWLSFSQFLTDSAPRRAQGQDTLPSFAGPNAGVYALWQDLHMRDDNSVCLATTGTAPHRSFVVEWSNLYFENNTTADGSLTFEVLLNEDDTIDVLYQTITPGAGRADAVAGATIGVENEATVAGQGHGGTIATQSHATPASGTGIRFTPMM